MDATQPRKSRTSDSNLNDRSAEDLAREKLVSKESYAKISERDDLDDFDDCGDEETQVSPELRQRQGEKRAHAASSMEDGKLGLQTIKIE